MHADKLLAVLGSITATGICIGTSAVSLPGEPRLCCWLTIFQLNNDLAWQLPVIMYVAVPHLLFTVAYLRDTFSQLVFP